MTSNGRTWPLRDCQFNNRELETASGQSGCQVAEDLHLSGRTVHLAVGNAGRIPRSYRGRDILEWDLATGYMTMPVEQHPMGTAIRFKAHPHLSGRDGGRTIDLRQMALDGILLHGKVLGVEGGRFRLSGDLAETLVGVDKFCRDEMEGIDRFIKENELHDPMEEVALVDWQPEPEPALFDLSEAGVSTVIYATGFQFDFTWIDLPVFDERGYPRYARRHRGSGPLFLWPALDATPGISSHLWRGRRCRIRRSSSSHQVDTRRPLHGRLLPDAM